MSVTALLGVFLPAGYWRVEGGSQSEGRVLSPEPIRGRELGLGQDTLPVGGRDELMSGYCHLIGHKGSIQVFYWLLSVLQLASI